MYIRGQRSHESFNWVHDDPRKWPSYQKVHPVHQHTTYDKDWSWSEYCCYSLYNVFPSLDLMTLFYDGNYRNKPSLLQHITCEKVWRNWVNKVVIQCLQGFSLIWTRRRLCTIPKLDGCMSDEYLQSYSSCRTDDQQNPFTLNKLSLILMVMFLPNKLYLSVCFDNSREMWVVHVC